MKRALSVIYLLIFSRLTSASCHSELFERLQQKVLLHAYSPLSTAEVTYDNRMGSKAYLGTQEIFGHASKLIENAKRQILFQTWSFDHDSLPAKHLVSALRKLSQNRQKAKAKIPVKVWLLINVTGLQNYEHEKNEYLHFIKSHHLNNQFVKIHLGIYRAKLLGANHAKNLIVDNQYALVTGANTSHYFNSNRLFDAGFALQGKAVHSMSKDFTQIWQHRFKSKISPRLLPANPSDTCLPVLFTRNDSLANFTSPPQSSSINWAFMHSSELAQDQIDIFTPSLNVTEYIAAIERAVLKGIQVRIILSKKYEAFLQSLPTRGGTNKLNVARIYQRLNLKLPKRELCRRLQVRWYSKDGVSPSLGAKSANSHVKYMQLDHQISYIGSANMDRQSWVNSREIGLFIDSKHLASEWNQQLFQPAFDQAIPVQECGGPAD